MTNTAKAHPEPHVAGSAPGTEPVGPDTANLRIEWFAQGNPVWRLEKVGERRDPSHPLGESIAWTPDSVKRGRATVVVGEKGSGSSSFRRWVERITGGPAIVIDFELGLPGQSAEDRAVSLVLQELEDAPMGWFKASVMDNIKSKANRRLVTTLKLAVDALSEQHGPSLTVLLFHVESQPIVEGTAMLASLRAAIERDRLVGVNLILLGNDPQVLSTFPYSAFLPVSNVYRLPSLDQPEIALLCDAAKVDKRLDAPREAVAAKILGITGGQLLLTQMLLGELQRHGDLQKATAAIRVQEDGTVARWRRRLAKLVQSKLEVRELVDSFGGGFEFVGDQPPPGAIPLYVAGWLGRTTDRNGDIRWRFSDLHQYWSADVLRDAARYARMP